MFFLLLLLLLFLISNKYWELTRWNAAKKNETYLIDNLSTRGASIGHRWGVKWLQQAIYHSRRLLLPMPFRVSRSPRCHTHTSARKKKEEEEEAPNIFCQQDCAYLQPSNNLLRRVGPVFAAKVPLNLSPQSQTSGKPQRNNVYFRSALALFLTMLSAQRQPVYLTHLPMRYTSSSQKVTWKTEQKLIYSIVSWRRNVTFSIMLQYKTCKYIG